MDCLYGVVLVRSGMNSLTSLRMKGGVAGEVCLTFEPSCLRKARHMEERVSDLRNLENTCLMTIMKACFQKRRRLSSEFVVCEARHATSRKLLGCAETGKRP